MKKIPSLFLRDFSPGGNPALVTREPNPECAWVVAGEGTAHQKWDGTACLIENGQLFKRYDAKHGKTPPDGFRAAQDPDPNTGHWPGWLPIGPDDKYHLWAWYKCMGETLTDSTYELVGPKVQGNPHGLCEVAFKWHGGTEIPFVPRNYEELAHYLKGFYAEGIVWHHPDGRMAKIKRTDFGLPWPITEASK